MIFSLVTETWGFLYFFSSRECFFSINKTAQASLYMDAFYSDSILTHHEAKGNWDAEFFCLICECFMGKHLGIGRGDKVMCKDFSQIDEVPPTEFWLFCLTENKDEQL